MKNKYLALTALLFSVGLAAPAFALDTPHYSRNDRRIQMTPYNVDDIVLVKASVGRAAHIVLSPSEKILDMASGNSEAWEFKDVGNNIYMKPRLDNADTNLIVTTDKRVYSFELRVVKTNAAPTYRLTFSYPEEITRNRDRQRQRNYVASAFAATPTIANSNYTMQQGKGSDDIKPEAAFDDGTFTYIRFARGKEMPVVFKVADNGEEEIINSSVKGDFLVLHGVYKTMMIRGNSAVIGLYNENYKGGSIGTTTGTKSKNVEREIVGGK